MSGRFNQSKNPPKTTAPTLAAPVPAPPAPRAVSSLLDAMIDGNEYGSIGSCTIQGDIVPDLRRAINDIQKIRKRPCIAYVANVLRPIQDAGITTQDHLPFFEMVNNIDSKITDVDVFLVTPGGVAHQVSQFVNALRPRFSNVEFLLPYMCMSAGTLWALSGDKIWMDSRAFIGPIDPQVPLADGRFVPAQSVLLLLENIKREGMEALSKGAPLPWHLITILNSMDKKEIGYALTASQYSITMAADYLEKFKFSAWTTHSSNGSPVSPADRRTRAVEMATLLGSTERWKAHGHGITRDVAWNELKIKVDHIETVEGLERSMRRLWALSHWIFDRTTTSKFMVSEKYSHIRTARGAV